MDLAPPTRGLRRARAGPGERPAHPGARGPAAPAADRHLGGHQHPRDRPRRDPLRRTACSSASRHLDDCNAQAGAPAQRNLIGGTTHDEHRARRAFGHRQLGHRHRPPSQTTAGGIVLVVGRAAQLRLVRGRLAVEGPVVADPDRRRSRCWAPRRSPVTRSTFRRAGASPRHPGHQPPRRRLVDGGRPASPRWSRRIGRRTRTSRGCVRDRRGRCRSRSAAGDEVAVSLHRAAVAPTSDQALWVSIRNSTNALGFDNYIRFMDRVLCGDADRARHPAGRLAGHPACLRRADALSTALPFVERRPYRLLKAATEVFLMINCGTDHGDFRDVDLDAESARLDRAVSAGDLETQFRGLPGGDAGRARRPARRVAVPGADPAQARRRRRWSASVPTTTTRPSATGSWPRSSPIRASSS